MKNIYVLDVTAYFEGYKAADDALFNGIDNIETVEQVNIVFDSNINHYFAHVYRQKNPRDPDLYISTDGEWAEAYGFTF